MTVPAPRSIRFAAAALAVGAVALLTLAPRSLVSPARGRFMQVMDAALHPVIDSISYADAERVLNALMFVPLGAAVALLLHRRGWPVAVLAGFALSAAVEYAQASIPGRVPDPSDVFWNTLGGAAGVAAITIPRLVAAAVRRRRRSPALPYITETRQPCAASRSGR